MATSMRIKSQWFQSATPKTPQQTASAMAFITWRVAQNTLKQMRTASFDIEVGPQYFAFTREVLVFLTQVLDRMATMTSSSNCSMNSQTITLILAMARRGQTLRSCATLGTALSH